MLAEPVTAAIYRSSCANPTVFSATGSLAAARYGHTATQLANGKVLVGAGIGVVPGDNAQVAVQAGQRGLVDRRRGLLDRLEEGSMWVRRLLDVNPNADLSSLRTLYEVYMKKPGSLDAFLDGLRKAGLPE